MFSFMDFLSVAVFAILFGGAGVLVIFMANTMFHDAEKPQEDS